MTVAGMNRYRCQSVHMHGLQHICRFLSSWSACSTTSVQVLILLLCPFLSGRHVYIQAVLCCQVASTQEMWECFKARGAGTQFYVYTLVSMKPGVPHIPVCVLVHDGSNDTIAFERVVQLWEDIWQHCHKTGIRLIDHCSDGDARLRRADLHLMRQVFVGVEAVSLAHPFVQLATPRVRRCTACACTVLQPPSEFVHDFACIHDD